MKCQVAICQIRDRDNYNSNKTWLLEIIDGCGGKKCNVKSYETLSLIFVWNCEEVTLCGKRHGTRDTGVIFFLDS